MLEPATMVTVFEIDNSDNIVYVHRPNGNIMVLQSKDVPMGHFDMFVPKHFKLTLYDDWDKYDDYIMTKITSDTDFTLMEVIVSKYLLYNLVKEKESFVVVGTKVFYLENPDLMLYRTDIL